MINIIELCALIVSAIAMISAIILGRSQIKQDKNNVVPHAEFMFFDSESKFYVKLKNVGMGPMIIRSMIITLDGEEKASVMSCFKNIVTKEEMKKYYDFEYGRIISKDRVISPNSVLFFIRLRERKDVEIIKDEEYYRIVAKLADTFRRIKIVLVFTDIYNQEFKVERNIEEYFYAWHTEYLNKC